MVILNKLVVVVVVALCQYLNFLYKSLSLRQNFVALINRTKSNQCEFLRLVEATKFCRGKKAFLRNLICRCDVAWRRRRCGAATFRSTSTQGVVGLWVCDVLQRRISCLEASYKQRANNFCHFMHVCVSAWLKQLRLTMDKYTLSHTSLVYLKMFHMFTLFKMNAFTSVSLKKLNFEKSF